MKYERKIFKNTSTLQHVFVIARICTSMGVSAVFTYRFLKKITLEFRWEKDIGLKEELNSWYPLS